MQDVAYTYCVRWIRTLLCQMFGKGMKMRKIARIHVFHAAVFAAWAGFVCLSAHAKTVALWPMELDPATGTFDGRDAVNPDCDLTLAAGNRVGEAQGVGWNLPPNPEPEANLMFPAVSRTAVRGWRTTSANGFSGGLDMWRVASGALTPEELLYVLADGTLLILK